jgi:hypothetical protein
MSAYRCGINEVRQMLPHCRGKGERGRINIENRKIREQVNKKTGPKQEEYILT